MSKVCVICGKKPSFGHNRSHSMVATKRRFNPNLQRVRILLGGKPTRAYVRTRFLKAGKVENARLSARGNPGSPVSPLLVRNGWPAARATPWQSHGFAAARYAWSLTSSDGRS